MAGLKVGRKTRGHKTHIFGVTELDTVTRKLTGKCYLREFNHYDMPTFKRIILSLAVPGPADDPTPIWGDMFPSYGFLHNEEHVEGFCYTPVNHIAGQLTTRSGASSNAAEWTVKTWRKQLADYNTRIPAKGDFGLHLSEMMWRLGQTSTCVGVPSRRWRDVAFFRLVVTLAEVGAALPKCADLAARGVYAPDPKVLATFSHLPCDIRDGDNSQIIFSKQDILKLHSFPPAASVSESVSATLFDFDPIIDRPPSPEAERHQRGRGRGRGRRGRGGSAPGGRGSRGAGRQSQRGGGGPAPQEPDAPVAGDDVKLLPGRAQQLRAQYKA